METAPDERIARIAVAVCNAKRAELFQSIAANLRDALSADAVFLAEIGSEQGDGIRILAASPGSTLAEAAEYRNGEMCGSVLRGKSTVILSAVRATYPTDALAVQLEAEGFAGTPLLDSRDKVIGVIAAVYRKTITDPAGVLAVLNTPARPAAGELERLQTERALRESEQRYKDFISRTSEGVWRLEFDPPIPVDLPPEELTERVLRGACFAEVNDAQAHHLGFDSAAELLGRRLEELEDF